MISRGHNPRDFVVATIVCTNTGGPAASVKEMERTGLGVVLQQFAMAISRHMLFVHYLRLVVG